ncbi:MAG: hypothetical protein E7560_06340 [Ruminococcaceae bacterium]|nr:hypothetical protein [Oscillospiraceae bacterium]
MYENLKFENKNDCLELAKRVAAEGIVLVRNNNNVLPVKDRKVAVFGTSQITAQKGGEGVKVAKETINITQGLINQGVNVDKELFETYMNWLDDDYESNLIFTARASDPEMEVPLSLAQEVKDRGADTAFIVLSRFSSENIDMEIVDGDFYLTDIELDMIKNVSSVFDKVVLVLHIGSCIDFSFLDECKIDGIIYTNYLGVIGADSLGKIAKGEISPSAKLPLTIAKRYEDYPSSANFGQHGGGIIQDYREDIYVGYRYFETFDGANENVLFPFGCGLSYTEFKVDDVKYSLESGKIDISAKITNIGGMAGQEVLQVYFGAPTAKDGAVLCAPKLQLFDFAKTDVLAVGESQVLEFSLNVDDMASYDDLGALGEKSCFVLEKGDYKIFLGTDMNKLTQIGVHNQPENRVIRRCHSIATTLPDRLTGHGTYEKLPQLDLGKDQHFGISATSDTKINISNAYNCEIKNLSELEVGESVAIKLLSAAGGTYKVSFVKGEEIVDISNCAEFEMLGVKVKKFKVLEDNSLEINIPISKFELTITALQKLPEIDAVAFKKIEHITNVHPNGAVVIHPETLYEASFRAEVENFEDDGFGNSGTCLSGAVLTGMYATYKLDIEEEGIYDIAFKYAYFGEDCPLSSAIVMLASNIVKPLSNNTMEKTYNEGEKRIFKTVEGGQIKLTSGYVYLKILLNTIPAPDIAEIILKKSNSNTVNEKVDMSIYVDTRDPSWLPKRMEKTTDIVKSGLQLSDVYKNPELMKDLMAELSNRELATLVSGTPENYTMTGDVGCTRPLWERSVPPCQTADGPVGLRQFGQSPVYYPTGVVLAASFNKDLARAYGESIAWECVYYGVDYLLGPGINICRNPAGGRVSTYYSEDPYLTGMIASNYVKGVQSKGVVPVVKHYAVNNSEYERLKSNSRVSERALREIYLKGFEITVKESNPGAIMSSYNHANDVKVCEDYTLITEIPRDEWNWDGCFMTDWWNDSTHIKELKAGHDIKMSFGYVDEVEEALNNGELSREQVAACAERVLRMILKIGRVQKMFDEE